MSEPALEHQYAYAAYESLADELGALPKREVLRVNVDVSRAATRALGAVPEIRKLLPEIEKHLPTVATDRIVRLDTYALAAWYAYASAARVRRLSATKDLIARAKPLRAKLLSAADLFSHGGFFDRAKLADIRGGNGHHDMAKDLVALAALLQDEWPRIGTQTLVDRRELHLAAKLGTELMHALGPCPPPRPATPGPTGSPGPRATAARAPSPCSSEPTKRRAASSSSSAGTRATPTESPRRSSATTATAAKPPRRPRAAVPRPKSHPSRLPARYGRRTARSTAERPIPRDTRARRTH